ncbi:MAG: hypothetical protein IPJ13_10210 [Saprospiraceae bacterium]|nr:hypothetical protein [Saprospiraceae bacterium]
MKIVLIFKKLFFLFLVGFFSVVTVSGQAWIDRIPVRADGKNLHFLIIKKHFMIFGRESK